MNFISIVGETYPIKGSLQLTDCEVISMMDYNYKAIAPSVLARLRASDDTKVTYQNTVFGKIIDPIGNLLPDDNINRIESPYFINKGVALEMPEVDFSGIEALLSIASRTAAYIEGIKIYRKYMSLSDITASTVITLQSKIDALWDLFVNSVSVTCSMTTGGSSVRTITVTGFIAPASITYNYSSSNKFGSLSAKLVTI